MQDHFDGQIERDEYGRYGNPTQRIAEPKLAALEGAGDCLLFASGMAAMTTTLFAMLSRGTHVVVTDDSYRRTRQFLNQTLSRYGIEVSTVPAGDYEALEDAIRPTTACSCQRVADQSLQPRASTSSASPPSAASHRVKTSSTPPSPRRINQRPLEFGVDLVMHSATKYLGGHNDLLAGAVLGSPRAGGRRSAAAGASPAPSSIRFGAYLLDPRAQDLRAPHGAAERQRAGASPSSSRRTRASRRVHYAGLPSHPRARRRPAADARLRRRGLLRGARRPRRGLARGRRLPHPAHRALARRRREPHRAARDDELLRAHAPRSGSRSASRTT